MADFRKWFYALALVALVMGLTIPASAQIQPFTCNAQAGVTPTIRYEGYTELVGDLILSCFGGTPTAVNQQVPGVNITLVLNTNITSKLTSGTFDEALLIIDEPNAPGPNSNRPILNCGATGAADSSPSAGPGVCGIISNGNPSQTYDGTVNGYGTLTCGTTGPAVGTFGCGRPNVYQGREGTQFNPGQYNAVTFNGIPVDPPGTSTTRTLRFTNLRADAEFLNVSSSFSPSTVTVSVSTNGSTSIGINISTQPLAIIAHGLIAAGNGKGDIDYPRTADVGNEFVQCNSENPKLSASNTGVLASQSTASFGGNTQFTAPVLNVAYISLKEGFANAWKTKNLANVLANGIANLTGQGYTYNLAAFPTVPAADLDQNVPGAIYNTESGFEYYSQGAQPNPNPPSGIGTTPVTGTLNTGYAFTDGIYASSTGISSAGIANQGTRLALSFSSVPTKASVWVQPVLYLYRQGSSIHNSLTVNAQTSGVMVLVSTDANGDGASSSPAPGVYAGPNGGNNMVAVSNNLAVWEILFTDTSASEQVDVPLVVSYTADLTDNLPLGYPTPNQVAQVTASFAPFYGGSFSPNPRNPISSAALPVPRFIPGTTPLNAFVIQRCACNLLFPFVTNQGGFDTGIAIANTTLDPGAQYGFFSTGQQTGSVTFFYYGIGANGAAQPAPQTSNPVPPGQVLTYVLSTGGGAIGSSPSGLNGSAAGFQGYIIAQSSFQYCHGYAFVSTANNPIGGVSEGYLGIVLDSPGLPRTSQIGENDGH